MWPKQAMALDSKSAARNNGSVLKMSTELRRNRGISDVLGSARVVPEVSLAKSVR